ncbi:MAG: GAF domain-containing protein [Oxalobacteraceae bacterium]|nr:MAG: GAF domain-containing protein [Oxalobacteraceae bacterium]
MTTSSPSEDQLDLTSCDREPIHIPGGIQPHGFLLNLSQDSFCVRQASENVTKLFGRPLDEIIGRSLDDLIGADHAEIVARSLLNVSHLSQPVYAGAVELGRTGYFDVIVHRSGKATLVEFEPVQRSGAADFRLLYAVMGRFLKTLSHVDSVDAICEYAVRSIREITGMGRVFLYSFDHNDDARVLAEALEPGYPSYSGQRFPASDIPQQARRLYLSSHVRLIADANYEPARLSPLLDPETGAPTDLSFAGLRAVSPVHLQYMKNMETLASMSISLVIKGRLWGMISCHDMAPHFVPFEVRTACEQLGQILALRIESIIENNDYAYRLRLRGKLVAILAALSQPEEFVHNMASASQDLLMLMDAAGAALVFEGDTILFGSTPPRREVDALVEWLGAGSDALIHTNSLSREFPPAAHYTQCASGMLAMSISRTRRHYLIWFRPEVVQTVEWAGNPTHKDQQQEQAAPLTPRKSFEVWRETVRGTSAPWQRSELEIALEFRSAILGIVLARAEEMAGLADELGRANKELESFSYSVSHDLRAPLRHIVGFTDLLNELEGHSLSERASRYLKNIADSARFAGKLVDDLLSFSQMGRSALHVAVTDMQQVVKAAIRRVTQDAQGRNIEWSVGPLPVIRCDARFIELAVYNLLSNAVKYSRDRPVATISVNAETTADATIFHFSDNGVGFSMEYAHKLFAVFQRLHRMEEFEGTGIGLANVRRIVERHGGQVWAKGELDKGAVFSFSIPKRHPA